MAAQSVVMVLDGLLFRPEKSNRTTERRDRALAVDKIVKQYGLELETGLGA